MREADAPARRRARPARDRSAQPDGKRHPASSWNGARTPTVPAAASDLNPYCVAMTLADTARPAPAPQTRRRGTRLAVGVSTVLLLVAAGTTAATYYYDSVPLAEHPVSYPVVAVADLPPAVANAFVAAVDPDFY